MSFTELITNLIFPKKQQLSLADRKLIKQKWQGIEDLQTERKESSYRLAVLEADKLLGLSLEKLGYAEETWAKSLGKAEPKFTKSVFKQLWVAHKTRNRIVHDHQHEFTSQESQAAIGKFRRGLKELKVL